MNILHNTRASENSHIVIWLVKDLCWVQDWRLAGVCLAPPAVLMAIWIAWRRRHDRGEFLHAAAVVSWIIANSTWMVGEFYIADSTRPVAVAFFAIGLGIMAWYYGWLLPTGRIALPAREAGEPD